MTTDPLKCTPCGRHFANNPGLQLVAQQVLREEGAAEAQDYVRERLADIHESHQENCHPAD